MYFVTICLQDRRPLFGQVVDDHMALSPVGAMIGATWEELPQHHCGVSLDVFTVMPDHVHGIVVLESDGEDGAAASLIDVVHWFKTMTTRRYSEGVGAHGWPPYTDKLWQRGYFERAIRTEVERDQTRSYIVTNALRWSLRHSGQ